MLKLVRAAAAAAALFAGMTMAAEAACVGPECPPSKPLDIQKFMREQAASTRAADRKHRARPAAQASKPDKPKSDAHKADRTHTAKRKKAPLPADATSSFAAHDETPAVPDVQVVTAGEFNAIDQAAPPAPAPAPAETVGAAPREQNVALVVADAFNEIDRKANDTAAAVAKAAQQAQAQAQQEPAKAETATEPGRVVSFLSWLWSAVTGTFAALAAAVRQLTGGVVP
jgi:hypothetical protein